MAQTGERLQKYLARAGIASRRKSEEYILAGRVEVNGEAVTGLGTRVNPGDTVSFDGSPVEPEPLEYYLLNKPAGVICSARDPQGRRTVVDLVSSQARLFPVGRLDMDTTGLLLLTNDGQLAHSLMHPRFEVDKVYKAVVRGRVTESRLDPVRRGMELEDGLTSPGEVRIIDHGDDRSTVELTIHEGRKRQVRRMMESLGHEVIVLHRKNYAMFNDTGLKQGQYRSLTRDELEELKTMATGRTT